jgi:hypothetical protein
MQSCSSENGITSPPEDKTTALAKTNVLPTTELPSFHINHSIDTVIKLPKSGKTILVSKTWSAQIIASIDDYNVAHPNISSIPFKNANVILPMDYCYECEYDSIGWEMEMQFKPAPGKMMGISTDIINLFTCYQYGFNQYITSASDSNSFKTNVAAAEQYFSPNNIGVWLPKNNLQDLINLLNILNCSVKVKYYLIDEPIETNAWGSNALWYITNYIAPTIASFTNNAKLILTSYMKTTDNTCGTSTGGALKNQVIQYFPNTVCVACDQYYGNCCGNTGDYWNDYAGFYGTANNFTNFMDVLINNGNSYEYWPCNRTHSSGFSDLFTNYTSHGDNTAWLYACACGGGTWQDVLNYSSVAYQNDWVLIYMRQIDYVFKNTDCTCKWGNGNWYLAYQYYTGTTSWSYAH